MMATTSSDHVRIPVDETRELVDPERFKSAFRMHPAGVAVISAQSSDGPVAMTISSLSSVSAEPPIVVFSLSTQSYATKGLLEAPTVVLHMVNSSQKDLAQLGASGGAERFADETIWEYLPTGEPAYKNCRGRLRVEILHRAEVGTGTVCIALVVGADGHAESAGEQPLIYFSRQWHELNETTTV